MRRLLGRKWLSQDHLLVVGRFTTARPVEDPGTEQRMTKVNASHKEGNGVAKSSVTYLSQNVATDGTPTGDKVKRVLRRIKIRGNENG